MRLLWTAVAAVLLASQSALANPDDTMRRLWSELHTMRDDPEFHALGFSAGGPYHSWSEELSALNRNQAFVLELASRCDGLVPWDLMRLARDYMNKRRSAATNRLEAAWRNCFEQ